jgi:hypothetical protein
LKGFPMVHLWCLPTKTFHSVVVLLSSLIQMGKFFEMSQVLMQWPDWLTAQASL